MSLLSCSDHGVAGLVMVPPVCDVQSAWDGGRWVSQPASIPLLIDWPGLIKLPESENTGTGVFFSLMDTAFALSVSVNFPQTCATDTTQGK